MSGGVIGFAGGSKLSKDLLRKISNKFSIGDLAARTTARKAFMIHPSSLNKTTRFFGNKVFKGCSKFMGGLLVGFAVEELFGTIFSAL